MAHDPKDPGVTQEVASDATSAAATASTSATDTVASTAATSLDTSSRETVAAAEVLQAQEQEAQQKQRSKVSRGLWAGAGFIFFALGAIGVALPILPTTPFILLAAFCFARSSERVNTWFKSTKLYKQVLEGFVTKRTMTIKAKLSILIPVTILLGIGFALMGRVPVGRAILAVVWIGHVIYFGFVVKTDKGETAK